MEMYRECLERYSHRHQFIGAFTTLTTSREILPDFWLCLLRSSFVHCVSVWR